MNTRLGVLTTLWQRHDLERLTLGHTAGLEPEDVELVLVAVGSSEQEGEVPRKIAEEAGWHYIDAPNWPLSDKHNAGVQAMEELGVDGFTTLGSDDLVCEGYMGHLGHLLRQGIDWAVPQTIYIYDAIGHRAMLVYGVAIGAGRLVGRGVLEELDYTPYTPGRNRNMDARLQGQVEKTAGRERWFIGDITRRGYGLMDVKTRINMWSYADLAGSVHTEEVEAEEVLATHFPEVADRLLTWED